MKSYLVVLILLSSLVATSSSVTTTEKKEVTFSSVEIDNDYVWLWDELTASNVPGSISGDDSVYWGSDLGPYYNSSEAIAKLLFAEQEFPEIVQYFEYGLSYENKTLAGVKISVDIDSRIYQKYDSLLVAEHHAREAITVIDALFFMDRILFGYQNEHDWVMDLLSTTNLYIIPVFNPDGLDYTHINPWHRKNMVPYDGDNDGRTIDDRETKDINGDFYVDSQQEGEDLDGDGSVGEDTSGGTDLNRNYDFQFIGSGSSDIMNSQTYRGPSPFSAPETYHFSQFVEKNRFAMSMSLHSGVEAIIYPWGYSSFPSPDNSLFERITTELQIRSYFPEWSDIGGYAVNGEWGDWMYGIHDSIAMTIETYGNSFSPGIWNFFNPDANDINSTTTQGVQKHLKYYFTVPTEDYYTPPYDIGDLEILRDGDELHISSQVNYITPGVSVKLEKFNSSAFGWDTIGESSDLSNSTSFSIEVDIPSGTSDSELRIHVGSASQGWSYYFNTSFVEDSSDPGNIQDEDDGDNLLEFPSLFMNGIFLLIAYKIIRKRK